MAQCAQQQTNAAHCATYVSSVSHLALIWWPTLTILPLPTLPTLTTANGRSNGHYLWTICSDQYNRPRIQSLDIASQLLAMVSVRWISWLMWHYLSVGAWLTHSLTHKPFNCKSMQLIVSQFNRHCNDNTADADMSTTPSVRLSVPIGSAILPTAAMGLSPYYINIYIFEREYCEGIFRYFYLSYITYNNYIYIYKWCGKANWLAIIEWVSGGVGLKHCELVAVVVVWSGADVISSATRQFAI